LKSAGLFALGLLIGAWGSLCGIGGGIFAVPVFHYLCGMALPAAVANSLVLVAVMTTGGTLFELARPDCALRWDVVGVLIAASWIGTQLGYRVAQRLEVRTLKLVFCVLLVAVAAEILLSSQDRSARAGAGFEWHAGLVLLVATTGLAAGFVAPLLGIGGGLIAVPALLFGLPSIGYLGARACSTAMSACNGWQSVWLYRKRDGIQLATAAWASAGALAGAWIGVRVAHVPGITFFAELIVALTLILVAARFAWDLRTKRYPGAS
jgi:hypothetical protein